MDGLDQLLAQAAQPGWGWMSPAVYRRLHASARDCPGGLIVEIGTYRGAATVALALGAQESGRGVRVLTADILRPGVGLEGASVEARVGELQATLERFGVAEGVSFVHGTARELVAAHDPRAITLLLLDGGGKIEADFALLWERMAPGCLVVIDDVDGAVHVERGPSGAVVDQKHRISKLLADAFVEAGLLRPVAMLGSTGWYGKGPAEAGPGTFERLALPCYHQLIKCAVPAGELGLGRALMLGAARKVPGLAGIVRRMRGLRQAPPQPLP